MRILICLLALAVFGGIAAADVDVTGKWSGSFNITNQEGQTKESTALLVLNQKGADISGTVGPNEGEQHPITKGRIEGDRITLESADGGLSIKFVLALAGDRITGDVTAEGEGRVMKAKLDVTRSK